MDTAQDSPAIRPARFWYVVAGAALVASVVWLVLGFVFGIRAFERQVDGFQRVPLPGHAELSLTQPGTYLLYFEAPNAVDAAAMPAFRVLLRPVGKTTSVSISRYGGNFTYHVGRHSGRAIGTFRIDQPGRFLMQTSGPTGITQADVAVGRISARRVVRAVLLTLAGAAALFLAGVALAVVVAVGRRRRRPTQALAAAGPYAPTARSARPAAPAAGPPGASASPSTPAAGPSDASSASPVTPAPGEVPAGWFVDPDGRHEFRYWDGQAWTDHVADGGAQSVDPL